MKSDSANQHNHARTCEGVVSWGFRGGQFHEEKHFTWLKRSSRPHFAIYVIRNVLETVCLPLHEPLFIVKHPKSSFTCFFSLTQEAQSALQVSTESENQRLKSDVIHSVMRLRHVLACKCRLCHKCYRYRKGGG